jgi:hypothetical protein
MQANTSPFFNVRDYGATGSGSTDDAVAINAAIAAASPSSSPTGNTVFFPAGTYLVKSALAVPAGLALVGAGWNTPGSEAKRFAGSWVFVEAGADFSPVTMSGSGGAVRNIGFNVVDQSTDGAPARAKPMVLIEANNTLVEDVCLYNPYGGISIDGGAQTAVRRVFGQPVRYGIKIDGSEDTNYIDGVHFWTYWQGSGTAAWTDQLANGSAITLSRCDNPHISNVFAFNYKVGLNLSSSPSGIPHKVHLVNADFDECVTGVSISSPGVAGNAAGLQLTNVTVQSPAGADVPVGNGIWVQSSAAYAMVQASNLRVSQSGLDAIRIDADNVRFYGENISLEDWAGDEGFYISSPSSFAWLGAGFTCTAGGVPYGPAGQFHLAEVS